MKLPEIKITLNGVEYEHTFNTDVQIDRTNLDDEFASQAEKYAFYGFLAEQAKHNAEHRKHILENVEASLDSEKRAEAERTKSMLKSFKYTETMCHNEVISDPRYKEHQKAWMDAKLLAAQLDICAKAIAMRKDMLKELGAVARIGTFSNPQDQQVREIISKNRKGE